MVGKFNYKIRPMSVVSRLVAAAAVGAAVAILGLCLHVDASAADPASTSYWRSAGAGGVLPGLTRYRNEWGQVEVLSAGGPVDTRGNPFFEPLGTNGRACVTCHQQYRPNYRTRLPDKQ